MSKHIVAIDLLNLASDYTFASDPEYVKLYFRDENLRKINSSGIPNDIVLDRTLDDFIPGPVMAIVETDTVLEAFQKLQAVVSYMLSGTYLLLDDYRTGIVLVATDEIEGVPPVILPIEPPNNVNDSFVIKILTNDVIEYWVYTTSAYVKVKTIRPVILDGNRINIVREHVPEAPPTEPTIAEIPSPIDGDTAVVFYNTGTIVYWAYTTIWVYVNTVEPTVLDGNDHHITRSGDTTNLPPNNIAGEVPSPVLGDTAKMKYDHTVEYWSFNGTAWDLNFTTTISNNTGLFINPELMPEDVGGWEAGSSFPSPGTDVLLVLDTLLYPYQYPLFLIYDSSLFDTVEVGTDIGGNYIIQYSIDNFVNIGTTNILMESLPGVVTPPIDTGYTPTSGFNFTYTVPSFIIPLTDISHVISTGNNHIGPPTTFEDIRYTEGRYFTWFYEGLVGTSPTDSSGVRTSPSTPWFREFLNSSNAGVFHKIIDIASQEFSFYTIFGQSILVIDEGNLNADVTAAFVSTPLQVEDANGINVSYEKHTIYLGILGLPNANFKITIS